MKKTLVFLCGFCIFASALRPDVPSPRFRQPDVPGFLQSMDYRTVAQQVFPIETSGMAPDPYSDLFLNPAFAASTGRRHLALDFNPTEGRSAFLLQRANASSGGLRTWTEDCVAPSWFSRTQVRAADSSPLFNLGVLVPVRTGLTLGLFHRTSYDLAPFLAGYSQTNAWDETIAYDARGAAAEKNLQRLETDHNQQTTFGTRTEAVAGWRVSRAFELGVRLGRFDYVRDGDLLDDRWSNQPHSRSAVLEDESLRIRGRHTEAEFGFLWRPNASTRVGASAGLAKGSTSESTTSRDSSFAWSERDTDRRYYDKAHSFLAADETFDAEGRRPAVKAVFERRFSDRWILRSAGSFSWSATDIDGDMASADTTDGDRTYDHWNNGSTVFRRWAYHGSRSAGLGGTGTEKRNDWSAFVSACYAPDDRWSAFGGIHLRVQTLRSDFTESSTYRSHRFDEYSLALPETQRVANFSERDYSMRGRMERWTLMLPVGFQIEAAKGFSVLLGSSVAFILDDSDSRGDLVYPSRITRKWTNGQTAVNDEETDRGEIYSSDPARVLARQWGRSLGLSYRHASGATVSVRFSNDVSVLDNWAFGFQMSW
jgi:hypothetical protein